MSLKSWLHRQSNRVNETTFTEHRYQCYRHRYGMTTEWHDSIQNAWQIMLNVKLCKQITLIARAQITSDCNVSMIRFNLTRKPGWKYILELAVHLGYSGAAAICIIIQNYSDNGQAAALFLRWQHGIALNHWPTTIVQGQEPVMYSRLELSGLQLQTVYRRRIGLIISTCTCSLGLIGVCAYHLYIAQHIHKDSHRI